MNIEPLGDHALIVRWDDPSKENTQAKFRLARALAEGRPAGVTEVVQGVCSLAVHYAPERIGETAVLSWLKKAVARAPKMPLPEGKTVEIPVWYGDFNFQSQKKADAPVRVEDFSTVAKTLELPKEALAALHQHPLYEVLAVGFTPGFPYLGGWTASKHLERRKQHRLDVPAGSVGVVADQAGVYPLPSPGGWHLLGVTAEQFFLPDRTERPTLLEPGDRVRFVQAPPALAGQEGWVAGVDGSLVWAPKLPGGAEEGVIGAGTGEPLIELLAVGQATSVQDLGRTGVLQWGVAKGGAADQAAARRANLLVGNPEHAPVLEMTLVSAGLRWLRSAWVALTGAEAAIPWPERERPFEVSAGTEWPQTSLTRGSRCYLAVAGGWAVPQVLGGAGYDARARMGGGFGRPLAVGDKLGAPVGMKPVSPLSGSLFFRRTALQRVVTVRFVRGAHWHAYSMVAHQRWTSLRYEVSDKWDRMALQLKGPGLALKVKKDQKGEPVEQPRRYSEPVTPGAVQVRTDGCPQILLRDCGVLGGYLNLAHVILADLDLLGQMREGTVLRFVEVSVREAQTIWSEAEANWRRQVKRVTVAREVAVDTGGKGRGV